MISDSNRKSGTKYWNTKILKYYKSQSYTRLVRFLLLLVVDRIF